MFLQLDEFGIDRASGRPTITTNSLRGRPDGSSCFLITDGMISTRWLILGIAKVFRLRYDNNGGIDPTANTIRSRERIVLPVAQSGRINSSELKNSLINSPLVRMHPVTVWFIDEILNHSATHCSYRFVRGSADKSVTRLSHHIVLTAPYTVDTVMTQSW
ncbi:hypothetical protein EVAR_5433_1 [Eumeta japonica]|uniref:Uncharacterized protein n=1 Tax=Eumeta variegata TaxID=151549 RepID=A0A4C1T9K1_EUMVA|nr:hypothetical protein EVAR_5433_1 [Eumeta japonica]